jgi:hypothetical protein
MVSVRLISYRRLTAMSLRDQLKSILPEILPESPSESIKGTELIRLVRFRLKQDYSDATLRYHFSIMCCDPSSPIAKVEQGQGYYLRAHAVNSYAPGSFISPAEPSIGPGLFEQSPGAVDLAITRARKFRSVYLRMAADSGRFPFSFETSFSEGAPYHNVWKFPDLAFVEWHVARDGEGGGLKLDRRATAVRAAMGLSAFSITTVKFKMEATHRSFREDFFQSLSHSGWANAGELVIAKAVDDTQLADELRQLGAAHGIGITTLGLNPESLDALPDASAIRKARASEFDAVVARLSVTKLAPARRRPALDWAALETAAAENSDARKLLDWLGACLESGRVEP